MYRIYIERECRVLKLKGFTKEQIKQLSMIELAYELLSSNNKQAVYFKDIVEDIRKHLDLSQDEVRARMSQFYTELNIDGRFLSIGENRWGLRIWYPYDQIEEEVVPVAKPKKKRAKKKAVEEEDEIEVEDFDDLDEEEYDELDELDDIDDIDEEDDDDDDDVLIDAKAIDEDKDEEDDEEDFDDDLLDDDYDLDDDEEEVEDLEDEEDKDK